MKRTSTILAVISIATLVASGCRRSSSPDSAESSGEKAEPAAPVAVEMADATRRPIEITISAQGTLVAAQGASARVAPLAAGRLASVNAREGDRVNAGQVVAVLDSRVQQAMSRSATAALTAAQAQTRQASLSASAAQADQSAGVKLARLTLRSAEIDRSSAVQAARTGLAAAETDLQKTRAGARPQERAAATANVNQARATRNRAATEVERVQFLFDKGIAARRQLEDTRTAAAVADAALETATEQESMLRAGARPEDLHAAEIRVEQARDTLKQAEAVGDAKVAQSMASLRQAEMGVLQVDAKRQEAAAVRSTADQKAADLAATRTTAQTLELRSPINGIVIRRALNPGDMADPASSVLEIADTRTLNLMASLTAEDGARVKAGMPARISTDSASGSHSGRVLSVGQVDPTTNLLAVRIAVANPDSKLRSGEFASASIIVRVDRAAVVVPRRAVVTRDGKQVVYTVADGVAHQRIIETGAEAGDSIEVVRGITAGDKVVSLGGYELSDGAKVKPAGGETEAEKRPGDADEKASKGETK